MNLPRIWRALALAATLGLGAAAQAATVDCPNGAISGRYVQVTGALANGYCYYKDGNLQNSDITNLGLLMVDKNGNEGLTPGVLTFTGPNNGAPGNSTSGNWSFSDSLWTTYSSLYLAFHFGNGQGTPDSFVVQLENASTNGVTSGTWSFNAIAPASLNGLSNYYLLGRRGGQVPEPASLALTGLALGLAGYAGLRARRRR